MERMCIHLAITYEDTPESPQNHVISPLSSTNCCKRTGERSDWLTCACSSLTLPVEPWIDRRRTRQWRSRLSIPTSWHLTQRGYSYKLGNQASKWNTAWENNDYYWQPCTSRLSKRLSPSHWTVTNSTSYSLACCISWQSFGERVTWVCVLVKVSWSQQDSTK